jgi:preprotein translocase subunit SecA
MINIQPKSKRQSGRPISDGRLLAGIHSKIADLKNTSDASLSEAFGKIRTTYESEASSQALPTNLLIEPFALAKESLSRTTKMSAYDVQVLAGMAMAQGAIAEMQTGEGKTLTTIFPIVAFALFGRGVHVATVNAYLAERDFEFLRPALELLGISVGLSQSGASTEEKAQAYACDVTFSTGYELGFDFLRDQIAMRSRGVPRLGAQLRRNLFGPQSDTNPKMQRGFAAAIIDEVDSVFIDEATTPLVLSAGALGSKINPDIYLLAMSTAKQLTKDHHFTIDKSEKSLTLTAEGVEESHQIRDRLNSQAANVGLLRPWQLYVESALRAQHIMVRDVNYVVREDCIEIVDEYTGRIFSDRNWRDGLHQAVETKEGVTITEERKTIARISRQRYFQRYSILCGMTGTADGHQRELKQCYRLPVVIIARRNQSKRVDLPTRYFNSVENKLAAIASDVADRNKKGQPVLIGTRTIGQSLMVSECLASQGTKHQVLNGIQDQDEASLIAVAGHDGCVTVATNMAGRGTDIKPNAAAIASGGLHVIGFEKNSSLRIDRQLLGRAGRQGDPGSSQFFVSAEDDIVIRFDPKLAKHLQQIKSRDGSTSPNFDRRMSQIQKAAEKVSWQSRQDVMREELWLDKVKQAAG